MDNNDSDQHQVRPRKKRRKYGKLSCRANKSRVNISNINKKYIANNNSLASKVAKIQREYENISSDIEEEKKDDDVGEDDLPDLINRTYRRNPPRAASQNSAVIIDEVDDDLENRVIDRNYYEDLSRGKMDDELFVHPTDKLGRQKIDFETRRGRRMGIYYFYVNVYKAVKEETGLWDGQNGIASAIRKAMLLRDNYDLRKIKNVMRIIRTYLDRGEPYTGDAEPRKEWSHYTIPLNSYQAQLTADLIEWGFGFANTTFHVNMYLEENNLPHVGRSTIYETVKRMKPKVTMIQKRGQGSHDPNSGWCQANHRWALQMLIMYRQIETQDIPKKFLNADGTLPDCFNEDKLPHIRIENVDFWDETHKKVRIGKYKVVKGGKQLEYRFPRGTEGLYRSNGDYRVRGTEYNMKYDSEARFSTGCAIKLDDEGRPVKDDNGEYVGEVLPLFEYTDTNICSHSDWEKAFWHTVNSAKIAGDTSEWVVTDRTEGTFYEEDELIKLRLFVKGKAILLPKRIREKLQQQCNINNVGELRDYFQNKPHRWRAFVKDTKGIGEEKFIKFINAAKECLPGAPSIIDYRKKNNPYLSRYGVPEWKKKVLDTPTMKSLTDVRDLVTHIVAVGQERRKDLKYADDWYFYHDALSFMTSNETKIWMEKKGWLKHWILPQHDLNKHIKYYRIPRPIGCNPGAMPWDASLNKDHDDIVLRHVAATLMLAEDDERKFSLSTPRRCASAYRRIYEAFGIPSKRIVQDIMKTQKYWQLVLDNDGRNINVNINGHRGNEGRALKTGRQGGARIKTEKKSLKSYWYHEDAATPLKEFIDLSEENFNEHFEKLKKEHSGISKKTDMLEPEVFEREDTYLLPEDEPLEMDDYISDIDE